MKKARAIKFIITAIIFCLTLCGGMSAQTEQETTKKLNSGFFPNPKRKAKSANQENEKIENKKLEVKSVIEVAPTREGEIVNVNTNNAEIISTSAETEQPQLHF